MIKNIVLFSTLCNRDQSQQDSDMIPWYNTKNIEKAQEVLIDMFNHFDEDSAVKVFLKNNCTHLLKAPTHDTGVCKNYFDLSNWNITNKNQLPSKASHSLFKSLPSKTGVYTIFSMPSNKFYIGSTTNLDARFFNHYSDAKSQILRSRPFYSEVYKVGGFNNFLWDQTVSTTNYFQKFIQNNLEYTNDYKVFRVLQTFTQYEVRIYEQALKKFVEPQLNGEGYITFTLDWDHKDIRPSLLGERPFNCITESGRVIEFTSLNSASDVLGISRKTITTLMNYPNSFSYSSNIGEKCRFLEPHLPLKYDKPYVNPYNRPAIQGIDYNKLPLDKVFAFTETFDLYDTYSSSAEAAIKCGLDKYYKVSRYINNRFIDCVIEGKNLKLLFAQNPLSKGNKKSVLCTDITTNTSVKYESVNDCTRALGLPTESSSNLIKNYIKKGKVFQSKYLITYTTN